MRRSVGLAAVLVFAGARSARAQAPALSGYYQNVMVGSAAVPFAPAGALDEQRARLMWSPSSGPWMLDVAYEHTLQWRDARTTGLSDGLLSSTRAGGDWLPLAWTIHDGARASWRQRFDRLSLAYTDGPVTVTVGRQAVSWATTLLLTPADPFEPFDPSDPFREYRTGIDAARVQWFAGPFTVVDFVVRPATWANGRTLTALARARTTRAGWELSAWTGAIQDEPGGAVGVTRTVAGSAVRAEAELRRDSAGGGVVRAAVGVDRRFSVAGRDLYAVLEYQHDGFGAAGAADLVATAVSIPAQHRELQVYGRDETALQLSYQLHPLVSAELLTLVNLRDGSALFSPAASVSVSDEISARLGVFAAAGPGFDQTRGPRSEYGAVPATGYAALSIFF
jgi:hypothetical protein